MSQKPGRERKNGAEERGACGRSAHGRDAEVCGTNLPSRRQFVAGAAGAAGALGLASLAACARPSSSTPPADAGSEGSSSVDLNEFSDLELSPSKWNYDAECDCYWQIGLTYCVNPTSDTYQKLAIFVPGAYFKASRKGSAYVCEVRKGVQVGNYTVDDAPFLLPLNAPAFAAQEATTSFPGAAIKEYLDAGVIYVYPGFRGRASGYDSATDSYFSGGAPWALADLKACVRYLRYNRAQLPGSTGHIFAFGHGAAGTLAALLGTTADAPEYGDYLAEVGAATHDAKGKKISDKVFGVASWCPLVPFDHGNAAYEWACGQYASAAPRAEGTFTGALSGALAGSYASYLNDLKLANPAAKDSNSAPATLTLDETGGGTYVAGSYYDYVLSQVEDAFNAWVADAEFPVTLQPRFQSSGAFPGGPNVETAEDAALSSGDAAGSGSGAAASTGAAGGSGVAGATGATGAGITYDSLEAYLAALNADYQWISYDTATGQVNIASLGAFVSHMRPAVRDVCAYDALGRDQPQNQLFGVDDAETLHFDQGTAQVLSENNESFVSLEGYDPTYMSGWNSDLDTLDSLEHDVRYRVDMLSPMHYLSGANAGFGEAGVAAHWRLRTGAAQAETSLTGELELACALAAYEDVADVDAQLVWGSGFEVAERTGEATANLLAWMESCCNAK